MKLPDTYKLQFHPLVLEVVEVLDFQGIPVLTVEGNQFGLHCLSYLLQFTQEGVEQRLVAPVTEARLEELKTGQISVRDAFNASELDQVFCLLYDEATGETLESWLLPTLYFRQINPIPAEYQIAALSLS